MFNLGCTSHLQQQQHVFLILRKHLKSFHRIDKGRHEQNLFIFFAFFMSAMLSIFVGCLCAVGLLPAREVKMN